MKKSKRFKQSMFDIRFNKWQEIRKQAVRKVCAERCGVPVKSPEHVELEKKYLSQTSDEGAIFRQRLLSTKHLETPSMSCEVVSDEQDKHGKYDQGKRAYFGYGTVLSLGGVVVGEDGFRTSHVDPNGDFFHRNDDEYRRFDPT